MKLLHLEDETPLRDVFRTVLDTLDENIELIQFISGDEADDYIEKYVSEIKLYVLDIRVPGSIDGMEVARRIRARGSKRPIIVNSGYRKPDSKQMRELELHWIPKPIHILEASKKIIPLLLAD